MYRLAVLLVSLSLNANANWVWDGLETDYYVWETLPASEVMKVCRIELTEDRPDGGCAPVRLVGGDAIIPPHARRMGDDSVVGERKEGKLCWIYSTITWAEAIWRGDGGMSHLAHEKKHCAGWSH